MGRQAREALEALGVAPARIFDAPNAHDHDAFLAARARVEPEAVRRALAEGLGCRDRIALVAGRLVPVKGIAPLLAAWERLPEKIRDDWTLLFVGSGPLASMIEEASAAEPDGAIVQRPGGRAARARRLLRGGAPAHLRLARRHLGPGRERGLRLRPARALLAPRRLRRRSAAPGRERLALRSDRARRVRVRAARGALRLPISSGSRAARATPPSASDPRRWPRASAAPSSTRGAARSARRSALVARRARPRRARAGARRCARARARPRSARAPRGPSLRRARDPRRARGTPARAPARRRSERADPCARARPARPSPSGARRRRACRRPSPPRRRAGSSRSRSRARPGRAPARSCSRTPSGGSWPVKRTPGMRRAELAQLGLERARADDRERQAGQLAPGLEQQARPLLLREPPDVHRAVTPEAGLARDRRRDSA